MCRQLLPLLTWVFQIFCLTPCLNRLLRGKEQQLSLFPIFILMLLWQCFMDSVHSTYLFTTVGTLSVTSVDCVWHPLWMTHTVEVWLVFDMKTDKRGPRNCIAVLNHKTMNHAMPYCVLFCLTIIQVPHSYQSISCCSLLTLLYSKK